jgi:hypothetical protein
MRDYNGEGNQDSFLGSWNKNGLSGMMGIGLKDEG